MVTNIALTNVFCVRDGQAATKPMLFEFSTDISGCVLTVYTNWKKLKKRWGSVRRYVVEEVPNDMHGRAFRIHRDAEAVEADGIRFYNCLVSTGRGPDLCDCMSGLKSGYCVHMQSMRWFMEKKKPVISGASDKNSDNRDQCTDVTGDRHAGFVTSSERKDNDW